MAKKMSMRMAMKKVEGSKADRMMDKKMGTKEGSPKDIKQDTKMAKSLMHKSKIRSAAARAFGGKY